MNSREKEREKSTPDTINRQQDSHFNLCQWKLK